MTQPRPTRPPATLKPATAVAADRAGQARVLAVGLLVGSLLTAWPQLARAADEPVDVPVTRGKVDLSGIKPALGPSATPPPAGAPAATTPPTRPRPRTVADDIADAKAKAAAEAAAKAQATATPVAAQASVPPAPSAPAAADKPMEKAAEMTGSAAAKNSPDDKLAVDKPPAKAAPTPSARPAPKAAPSAASGDDGLAKVAVKLVEAMAAVQAKQDKPDKRQTPRKPVKTSTTAANVGASGHTNPSAGHDAHGSAHWTYEGDTGPTNWAKLKPEFNVCAIGQRQSPIAIEDSATLQGPAEPIGFQYQASAGSVVNNGHTIQVDLAPGNSIAVRSGTFELLQFHFHHPSEEQVNGQRYAMVAHLVHKNAEGQLAVVAVLLTPGEANPAVDTVWKYMPVDTGDRVKLPTGVLNLPELLPKDQRYYQFMGSLTTPPCTEGVLWMVLKTPVTLSPAQIRLFGQLFPNNARPVQSVNGRPVREAL